jgi:hypothetical protein
MHAVLMLIHAFTPFIHAGTTPVVIISSLAATSVTVSWSLPDYLVANYSVSIARVTGSGQVLCLDNVNEKPAIETSENSISFTGLEEFSIYMVTVSATFGNTTTRNKTFTSLSAGMSICMHG